jgi:hypothetical protein
MCILGLRPGGNTSMKLRPCRIRHDWHNYYVISKLLLHNFKHSRDVFNGWKRQCNIMRVEIYSGHSEDSRDVQPDGTAFSHAATDRFPTTHGVAHLGQTLSHHLDVLIVKYGLGQCSPPNDNKFHLWVIIASEVQTDTRICSCQRSLRKGGGTAPVFFLERGMAAASAVEQLLRLDTTAD